MRSRRWGPRHGARSLLLWALLFSLFGISSISASGPEDYSGPALPDGWYPIHESELETLSETLTRQSTQIEKLSTDLARTEDELHALAISFEEREAVLESSITSLETAKASLTEYAAEAATTISRLERRRNAWRAAATVGLGYLVVRTAVDVLSAILAGP